MERVELIIRVDGQHTGKLFVWRQEMFFDFENQGMWNVYHWDYKAGGNKWSGSETHWENDSLEYLISCIFKEIDNGGENGKV